MSRVPGSASPPPFGPHVTDTAAHLGHVLTREWAGPPVPLDVAARANGVIMIDVDAIGRNWRSLADLVRPAECAAVVKADAYGLGAARVVPALWSVGCRTFFVATAAEAIEVRGLVPDAVIYVLDGVSDTAELVRHRICPVLSNIQDVIEWGGAARNAGRRLAAALQIETGLNRLGLEAASWPGLDDWLRPHDVTLLMSHLACADEPGHPMNARQLAAFEAGRKGLPGLRASLSASDGLMLGKPYHFDLVRPGYALYGGQAFGGARTPVEPVVRVAARILQVLDVVAGDCVGYGASWVAPSARRIATIAAGYADGLPRHASSAPEGHAACVIIRGQRCPIVGRVSMDLTMIDVSDLPGPELSHGEWAELVGPALPLEEAGRNAGTIGYEILTRLSRRFHRIYYQGGS